MSQKDPKVIDIVPILEAKKLEEHMQKIYTDWDFFREQLDFEAFYQYVTSYIVSTGLKMLKGIDEDDNRYCIIELQRAVEELSKMFKLL